MSSLDVSPLPNTPPRSRAAVWGTLATHAGWLLPVLLFGVAAWLRVTDLGGFLTVDEANSWIRRTRAFAAALASGDMGGTAITAHPGITTMWLGTLGRAAHRALVGAGWLAADDFHHYLLWLRLPGALVQAAAVAVGYVLLRRLFAVPLALLAAALWATDPFSIAYSRVLHVDGLATAFITLSMLAACVAWLRPQQPHPRAMLLLSGACGALATLSKFTALLIVPAVGLLALYALYARWEHGNGTLLQRLWAAVPALLWWGGAFVLTVLLVLPATWADPARVLDLLRASVTSEGGQPHVWGNYYLGRSVALPDATFYAVAVALRSTPLTLVGLLLLPIGWWATTTTPDTRRTLAVLAVFVLLVLLVLTVFPKKLNRYAVLTFPTLAILAAAGWTTVAAWLAARTRRRWLPLATAVAVALAAAFNAAHWHPYSIVAANQLLGGAPAGVYAFASGWGEGLDAAAAWLTAQPDSRGVTIASERYNSFQPMLPQGVQAFSPAEDGSDLPPDTGYLLVYRRQHEHGTLPPPYAHYWQHERPMHTVTLHGVPYVWIYAVPRPLPHPAAVTFAAPDGGSVTLHSYGYAPSDDRQTLDITVQWRSWQPPAADYLLFVHVLDSNGQRVAQLDAPPQGSDTPTSAMQPGRYYPWRHPIPAALPPGDYWLAMGLYDPATGARLPVQGTPPALPSGAPAATGYDWLVPLVLDSPDN